MMKERSAGSQIAAELEASQVELDQAERQYLSYLDQERDESADNLDDYYRALEDATYLDWGLDVQLRAEAEFAEDANRYDLVASGRQKVTLTSGGAELDITNMGAYSLYPRLGL